MTHYDYVYMFIPRSIIIKTLTINHTFSIYMSMAEYDSFMGHKQTNLIIML